MKTLNNIGIIVLILSLSFLIVSKLEAQNPCSAWAEHPSECNSDRFEGE